MVLIVTNSTLEARVCETKALDSLKPRVNKAGPPRQGQLGHRLAESYLGHLLRVRQPTDFEAGARMWSALKAQASAEDVAGVEASVQAFILENDYSWLLDAEHVSMEERHYVTIPDGREVPEDRVHLLTCPVFRSTTDLMWYGRGPAATQFEKCWHILDWKWHHWIEHVSEPAINIQLRRYSAARLRGKGQPVCAWLAFPRKHSYYEHEPFYPEQLEAIWRDDVVAPSLALQRFVERPPQEPDLTVGGHCRTCDLRPGCDAAQRYPYEAPWVEGATPEARVTALALAEQIVSDLRVRVQLDTNAAGGAINVGGGVEAKGVESESLELDADDCEKLLRTHMGDLWKLCLKATKTSIDNALKDVGLKPKDRLAIIDELRPLAKRQLKTALKVAKPRPPRKAKEAAEAGEAVDEEGSA